MEAHCPAWSGRSIGRLTSRPNSISECTKEPSVNLIELKSVSKHYTLGEGTVPALSAIDLAVGAGEFLAITGPSGSGKTTLLNLIGCLDLPTTGEVLVNGRSTAECSERELDDLRSRTLGMIFQSFNLIPVLTARENVAL